MTRSSNGTKPAGWVLYSFDEPNQLAAYSGWAPSIGHARVCAAALGYCRVTDVRTGDIVYEFVHSTSSDEKDRSC